ncbi:MAG: tetratricopeptide repeat protein [Planctomycetota bacterium]|jgi:tetratricopeptide (TPR) repeat protein
MAPGNKRIDKVSQQRTCSMIAKEKKSSPLSVSHDIQAGRRFDLLSIAIIFLLTVIVYANSINNDFTNWDDPGLVIENSAIRSLSVENLLSIFTPQPGLTYQPVRVLSYAIDYFFWQLNPAGYHLGNTLLHGLAAVILYFLLASILEQMGEESPGKSVRTIALFAVLLFVVHPVNVESVAWVSSRKYGLLAFFTFLSFYLYLKSAEVDKPKILLYLFSIITYILALLSSPFAVVLPGLIILYDFCRSSKSKYLDILKSRLRYYILYIVLGFAHFLLLMKMVSTGPNPAVKEHYAGKAIYTLLTMIRVLYDYLRNLLIPIWLNNRYIDKVSSSLFDYKIIISIVFLIVIFIFIFKQLKSDKKIFIFCLGWFFITLLPVSNIIPISTKMADRYLYLPAVGFFVLFSVWLHSLAGICFAGKFRRLFSLSLVIPLIFAFSYLTIQRNKVWANSLTLWQNSLSQAPHNPLAHLNLGEAMYEQERIDEAVSHYWQALRIKPDYAEVYNNLGVALADQERFEAAIDNYLKALKIEPQLAAAHSNLGVALAKVGKHEGALFHSRKALQLEPRYAGGYNNLGNVLAQQGKMEEAVANYSLALQLNPGYADAHNNLAVALARLGRYQEATSHHHEALRLKPNTAEAHNNLGVTLKNMGQLKPAMEHFLMALQLSPEYADPHNNLGDVFLRLGKLDEAVAHFSRALEIRANFPEAQNNLGVALARQGRFNEAIGHFNEALRLKPDYLQARANLDIALQMLGRANETATTGEIP